MQRILSYNILTHLLRLLIALAIGLPVILSTGCSGRDYKRNPELMAINGELSQTDIDTELAAALLDSLQKMDSRALSESERSYRDFLIIKASDKAYITHTSDSLYLSVKDRLGTDKELGPEVLYYGGRVYSDMGNYPVALVYFQSAKSGLPLKKH